MYVLYHLKNKHPAEIYPQKKGFLGDKNIRAIFNVNIL